ncbi:Type IV pilus biogenesis protein PilO [Candidatus Nitrotoga sp. HW29]|uniref:type 4a pilus biogenesis protein PilO n=1 Tax=Candidatus Nitrotoga sp. HW29 TaxID=2886963 RepID=UPI001EF3C00D|nr:type 4a pilus biogenesis protein PilO [Candidatus Nitrotoga sp. HW29]CAH1904102.1 Type IV pilus biogenesis protein PilO [Candidatus Nitrotoga sp. HW29]
MRLLEDLKNINPKDPGSWPLLVKVSAFVAIFVTVLLLGTVLDWKDRWEALSNAKQIEATLKTDFKTKKAIAINLDVINKKLTEARQSFDALLKQLPSKSEMDALLTDINQAGLGRGLQFELFKPGTEIITGVFAEQAITIKVTGNYDDIGKFASDIAQLPRIVSLSEISINPTGGHLTMDTIAKTYRYLDEEELTAQKQSSKTAGAHK